MAWSAAVRKVSDQSTGSQPSPLPGLQLESLSSCEDGSNGIAIAVIDANALISFNSSTRLLNLAFSSLSSYETPRIVTVKEVLEEVRDPTSRFHLGVLSFSVDCIDPTDEALQKVIKFARETGDLASLSDVDLKLLALTYMLEEQAYGSAHLRTRPPPVHVAQVRHLRERDLPGWGTNVQNLEEWEQLSQEADNMIDEGSHILGLRNLSLDASEQGNIMSVEEHESSAHQEVHMSALQGEGVHCVEDVGMSHDHEDFASAVSEEGQDPVPQSASLEQHAEKILTEAAISDGAQKHEDTQESRDEQVDEDGGNWQRAVSRSTRRKHEKRAVRAAMKSFGTDKQEVESIEHKETSGVISQADDVNSDAAVYRYSGVGKEDAGEAMLDECNNAEDGDKSDGDCPSVSKSSAAVEEKRAFSSLDTESEASWALRPLSHSKVACVTADFPMQNVLLQIGLRVVSPNGLQIQQLHRWALKCEACRNVTLEVGRIFCPKCGNGGTLYKVSITVGSNGVMHTGTRKRFNIRGTKYSLPLPKAGRQGVSQNPILREDQLPKKMLKSKKKVTLPDFMSPAEIFETKSGGKQRMEPPIREALAIFSGKRNPNCSRSKQRG